MNNTFDENDEEGFLTIDHLSDLNEGQREAADEFLQFLLSPDKEYALSGPGGVGKTYLLNKLLTVVVDDYKKACSLLGRNAVDYDIALTATTNKAAEVLRDSLNKPASTIHSYLGLKIQTDYGTGKKRLTKTSNWTIHHNKIIVLDEASMTDSKLKALIEEATANNCKLVYVGDHCQLAPVQEKLSKVYSEKKRFSYLIQPMRNAGQPALIKLCADVRKTVETLDFYPMLSVPGVIDHLNDVDAQQFIEDTFIDENVDGRILAYSNPRVNEYNTTIRALRGHPNEFVVGENLVAARSLQIGHNKMMQVEEEIVVVEDQGFSNFIVDPSDANAEIKTQVLRVRSKRIDTVVQVALDATHADQLKKYYFSKKDWKKAYSIEENIADLRPRVACTVHKSQGSTYDFVFIDLENIGKCTHNDEVARLLYVAVSRARNRVVMYGQLPKRLFT